jgi:geranylgeranyl diphosphate synthase type I
MALPAAAGVELVHTWTLTHDDLIDHDETRRHKPTVHVLAAEAARLQFQYDREASSEYGQRIAILVGDAQHAWSVALFLETPSPPVDASVINGIVHLLESRVIPDLIRGETLDVQFETCDPRKLPEEEIVEMLRLKTGVLYEFSAMAGAMIGLNCFDEDHPTAHALARFARYCGIAFQLQDDVLGIIGDEASLGKPVGSDIREGKRTTILRHSLTNPSCSEAEATFLNSVVGNRAAGREDVSRARELLVNLGGIEHTKSKARAYVERALPYLDAIPDSPYRDLLATWAEHMIQRKS